MCCLKSKWWWYLTKCAIQPQRRRRRKTKTKRKVNFFLYLDDTIIKRLKQLYTNFYFIKIYQITSSILGKEDSYFLKCKSGLKVEKKNKTIFQRRNIFFSNWTLTRFLMLSCIILLCKILCLFQLFKYCLVHHRRLIRK